MRIDGFVGVFWDEFKESLRGSLADLGVDSQWIDVSLALREQCELNELAYPSLGGDDPLFGKRYQGELADLFDMNRQLSRVREKQKTFDTNEITVVQTLEQ